MSHKEIDPDPWTLAFLQAKEQPYDYIGTWEIIFQDDLSENAEWLGLLRRIRRCYPDMDRGLLDELILEHAQGIEQARYDLTYTLEEERRWHKARQERNASAPNGSGSYENIQEMTKSYPVTNSKLISRPSTPSDPNFQPGAVSQALMQPVGDSNKASLLSSPAQPRVVKHF